MHRITDLTEESFQDLKNDNSIVITSSQVNHRFGCITRFDDNFILSMFTFDLKTKDIEIGQHEITYSLSSLDKLHKQTISVFDRHGDEMFQILDPLNFFKFTQDFHNRLDFILKEEKNGRPGSRNSAQ